MIQLNSYQREVTLPKHLWNDFSTIKEIFIVREEKILLQHQHLNWYSLNNEISCYSRSKDFRQMGFGYYHCVETDYVQDSKRRVHLHNLYTVNLRILQANLTNLFV